MNIAKASWRCKSPKRKIQSLRKLRPGETNETLLASIAAYDGDMNVRVAAMRRLCSITPIASFINASFTESEGFFDDDPQKFSFVEALTDAVWDDADCFDIVMHADFGLPESRILFTGDWQSSPRDVKLHALKLVIRKQKSEDIRSEVSFGIVSNELRARIVRNWRNLPASIPRATLSFLRDKAIVESLMEDETLDPHLAIRAARMLKPTERSLNFLSGLARDVQRNDNERLHAAYRVPDKPLQQKLLREILQSPHPDDERFCGKSRLIFSGFIKDEAVKRRLYEEIARNAAYGYAQRLAADEEARDLGGASLLGALCEEIQASEDEGEREAALEFFENDNPEGRFKRAIVETLVFIEDL